MRRRKSVLILIIGLIFGGGFCFRAHRPNKAGNVAGEEKPIVCLMNIEDKQIQNKKNQDQSRKINSERLLFLRSEWLNEWEPGLPEHASQLIVTQSGRAQWAIYTRKEIVHLYKGHLSCNTLLSKALEVDFFNLRKQYITKMKPWDPLPEGHPAQVIIVMQSNTRSHGILSEQELMPSSLLAFTKYLKERAEVIGKVGIPARKGTYLRIIPVQENSILEINKLGIYRTVDEKEMSLYFSLLEALSTTFCFVRLDQKEKHLTDILGKKKGKHFYPFFKVGSTLYEARIYLFNEGATTS